MKKEKQDARSVYKKMSMLGSARSPSEQRLMALLRIEEQKEQERKKKAQEERERKEIM